MRTSILFALMALVFSSCEQEQNIVKKSDYLGHIHTDATVIQGQQLNKQLAFWQSKLDASPTNGVYLQKIAGLKAEQFDLTHDVDLLLESDDLLRSLHERFPNEVSVLHQLVGNCITRHAFNEALEYADKAYLIGEKKHISQLLLVDVLLEKGALSSAQQLLASLKGSDRFDKQIRWMKIHDAEGDLDMAIVVMEKALANANESNNQELLLWSLSNLGDMYGHQGKIRKSYDTYLEALAIDPSDRHSLKGIGWIALSHDRDFNEAIEIWESLKERGADPELDLLLSEAYQQNGNSSMAEECLDAFIAEVSKESYGNMYGSYLVDLYDGSDADLGFKLAEADVMQREHPVTYSKYALALHKIGRSDEAVEIIKKYVIGQTEEPDAFYISGVIFQEAGIADQAEAFLEEALAASYELGPSSEQDIRNRLQEL